MSTGNRSITGRVRWTSVISACGPPVDEPIRSARGACVLTRGGLSVRYNRSQRRWATAHAADPAPVPRKETVRRDRAADLGAEMTNFLNEIVAERFRRLGSGCSPAWNIV